MKKRVEIFDISIRKERNCLFGDVSIQIELTISPSANDVNSGDISSYWHEAKSGERDAINKPANQHQAEN